MRRFLLIGGALACAALALSPLLLVLAIVGAGAAAAADTGTVTIPYGDLVTEGAHIASAILTPIILLLLGRLTGPVGLWLRTFLGEQLIRNAVAYAVSAVDGATKGKTLSVNVGSAVFAEAVNYALKEGAPWLVSWLGGPDGIRKKVFRALDLEEGVTKVGLLTPKPPVGGSGVRKAA